MTDPGQPSLPSPPAPLAGRVAAWLVRHRLPLFIAGLVLVAGSVERARHLRFSRSIDAMFDRSDPALVPYARMTRTFGGSEVVLCAYDDPELFTPAGIERLADLTGRLGDLPGVAATTSLATTPLGSRIVELEASPTARRIVALMEGYVVGADHRTAAVACTLEPPAATLVTARQQAVSRAKTIDLLREIMAELPAGTVAGEPAMLRDGFAMLEWDGTVLAWASVALTGGVLLFFFRSIRWVVVPMGVVLTALWTTRGILSIAGAKLTMVSTMLSAMITVVGIATVTHLIVEFRRQREQGFSSVVAMERTLAVLLWPVAGAIATDMIGFGALVASRVGPVHDFGIMTALGAAMVLVAVLLVVPFLAVAGRLDADPRRVPGEGALERALDRVVRRIVRRPVSTLAVAGCLAAVAMLGIPRLEVETDFTKNFRASSPIPAAYDRVETRLGGAGVWDVLVPIEGDVDAATLVAIDRLESRLRAIEVAGPEGPRPALTKVMSVADLVAAVSPLSLERLSDSTLGNWLVGKSVAVMRDRLPGMTRAVIGRDPADGSTWLRVMLRARERQPAEAKRAIIDEVREVVAGEFPADAGGRAGEVTGFFVLLASLVERMVADQWLTFTLAALGIFVMLSLAFRSPLIAAVALVPNALPILLVLGLLGWIGRPVNMGTAMIAAVSMGLSVDSSIHYVTAFRRRLDGGQAVAAALAAAHQTAGRAIVFSTLALVVGFLALCTSSFIPTVSFGALSCLTLAGGLAGNLVVLPVLLSLFPCRNCAESR